MNCAPTLRPLRSLRLNSESESYSYYVTFVPFVVNYLLRLRLCRARLFVVKDPNFYFPG